MIASDSRFSGDTCYTYRSNKELVNQGDEKSDCQICVSGLAAVVIHAGGAWG